MPNDWIPYQPHCNREKEYYDIMLRDGAVVPFCYPNSDCWNPHWEERTPKGICYPIKDYRVTHIRISTEFPDWCDGVSPLSES